MRVIKSNFEEIFNENPQKHIEQIARTCYKSNHLITDISNKEMIFKLYNNNHWAMLEHYIFIYEGFNNILKCLKDEKYINYTNINNREIISFSARSLLDILKTTKDDLKLNVVYNLINKIYKDYHCYELFGNLNVTQHNQLLYEDSFIKLTFNDLENIEEQLNHCWSSIKFICDRGISHEIVRHRDASFAQESTRYCNYSKNKFGNEITVIEPSVFFIDKNENKEKFNRYNLWVEAMNNAEKFYFDLLEVGSAPQEARSVLPNSLKTEIIMTARFKEWIHFLELRCDSAAHPQMRELALSLFAYFYNKYSNIFNNSTVKFN